MIVVLVDTYCFYFKQKTAYEMRISDWSSDVCSSDLSFKERRDYLLPEFERLGLHVPVVPDGAFYIYADIRAHSQDSSDFSHRLLHEAGVAAVPGLDFGPAHAAHSMRFSYATGLDRLKEAVSRMERFLA